MKFAVLGPFTLVDDNGTDCTPRPKKLRTVLALLAANADQVVSSRQIASELWPVTAPRTADTAMYVYISKIRKHLQRHARGQATHDCVVTRPPGYLLRSTGHDLDLARFHTLSVQSQEAEQKGNLEEASALLSEALNLWDGAALADVREGSLLRHLARQLDEAQITTYERRMRLDLMLDRHQELVGELYALVEQYPQWESFHRYLMIALYRAGRTAEALAVFTQLRARLIESLGMEPDAESQRLHWLMLTRNEELDKASGVQARLKESRPGRIVNPRGLLRSRVIGDH